MSNYELLIGGSSVSGNGGQVEVINPATEQVISVIKTASREQMLDSISSAKAAARDWGRTSFEERANVVNKIAQRIEDNSEELAKLIVAEQGKTLGLAQVEVGLSVAFCNYFAEQKLEPEILVDDDTQRVEILRKPLGVVACIMPWNFPFVQAVYKLAPAIMAGNTTILKPSPFTPLSTLKLGDLIADLIPSGVVNVIADNNDLGKELTSHPDVNVVSFTGSTNTGKAIMSSASETLKRLTLECGGNDAGIVLDDVDPAAVAPGIFGGAFMNSGQVCVALKRLYVHESIYDGLCDELVKLANNAVIGDGMLPETEFGPVQNKAQFEKILEYIEDAKQNGEIIAGGTIPEGPGYFLPLTIVRDIHDGTRLVDEEPFGPILPVIKYSDLDEVIGRANDSPFGLGGSVWSSNEDRARKVAERLECGTAWINQHPAFAPNVPFPASKQSGIGVEWGADGIEEYTAMQVVNLAKA